MKRFAEKGQKVFFTSDHHFGHTNIIEYCNRPYKSTDEMNVDMIVKWNKVVGPDDVVFHLGDFTLSGPEAADAYFRQLNGKVYILCNEWHHDKRWILKNNYQTKGHTVKILPPMVVLENSYYKKESKYPCIVLCHYPLYEWDRSHHGSLHLFGHSHSMKFVPKPVHWKGTSYNVGVDMNNFTPLELPA